MTNPGSLTMGFSGVDPRQLAPCVGTTQVGITISAVPTSTDQDSRTGVRSGPLERFKFTASVSITASGSPSLQPNQVQRLDGYQIHHRRKRNRGPRRQAQEGYSRTPLEESRRVTEGSPISRRPAAARTPATRQDSDSETQTGDYYDPDRRTDEFANFIWNQSLSDGIELDPRVHSRAEDRSQIFQVSRRRRHAGSSKLI